MQFIFVRHGEPANCYDTDGNYRPSHNANLSENGILQAQNAGRTIAQQYNPKHIISSDIPRALQTAQIINEQFDTKLDIETTEKLRELHIAEDIIGSPLDEDRKKHLLKHKAIPFNQAFEICKKIIKDLKRRPFNGNVVIATHGLIMNLLKFCASHDTPDYEKYLSMMDHRPYTKESINNFCKMFVVEL